MLSRRVVALLLLAVGIVSILLLATLSLPGGPTSNTIRPVHPVERPEGSTTPLFLSSAPPNLFVGENFSYALSAQVPVNWTCLTCPLSVLIGGPLSKLAGLHGKPTVAGTLTFSIRITDSGTLGGVSAWQNWTSSVFSDPKITSTPSFLVTVGSLYDYHPFTVGGAGTWAFVGAPYFVLNATTGEVKGTPTAGTFNNALTFTSGGVSWTQYWITTNATLVPFLSFSTMVGSHPVTAKLPTYDVAGSGYGGVYLGLYPVFNSTNYAATDAYNLTYFASVSSFDLGVVGSPHSVTLYEYASPLSTVVPFVNGGPLSPVSEPNAGFVTVAFLPTQSATLLSASSGDSNNVRLSWTNPSGSLNNVSVSYAIQSANGNCPIVNGTGQSLGSVPSTTLISGLRQGKTYCFAVQHWNGASASAFSNVASVVIVGPSSPPPNHPPIVLPKFPSVSFPPIATILGYIFGFASLVVAFLLYLAGRRDISTPLGLLAAGLATVGVIILLISIGDPSLFR